ncbi:hypothetical protein GLAREA_05170 [Glarea lozoyensis ATCC 20868]|uniref:Protein kinase-like (PK-like) n=1 Tax=Glarea lozoyensis (strain ATCC 20868 / MF5171) TaxID=1116229 RepID=S3DBN3_GLAL2|nr:uncharacterized protein GLAREA_05170 [Glarea lozoyensis ATCC 20868]EPE35832.1 hypothetical protein GLAREA_05170 [Glarea lozoyensis ATCC 20868]
MWKESDGTLFVVMERLPGQPLDALWPSLPEADKTTILQKTRSILDVIRTIPPPDFFGSVDKRHIPHHLFYWPEYPEEISGPYTGEHALIQGLVKKSKLTAKDNGRYSYLADFFQEQITSCPFCWWKETRLYSLGFATEEHFGRESVRHGWQD